MLILRKESLRLKGLRIGEQLWIMLHCVLGHVDHLIFLQSHSAQFVSADACSSLESIHRWVLSQRFTDNGVQVWQFVHHSIVKVIAL